MDGELILGAVKVQSRSCVMPRAMLVMGTDATRSFFVYKMRMPVFRRAGTGDQVRAEAFARKRCESC